MSAHRNLVLTYSDPANVFFIEDVISEVFIETPLNEIFEVDSNKTPDLVYLTLEGNNYIGEVKGNFNIHSLQDAREQLDGYKKVMMKNMIPSIGFLVVGDYIEVEGGVKLGSARGLFG